MSWKPAYDLCDAVLGTNDDRLCVGCGDRLTGRLRKWCASGWCEQEFWGNHYWSMARERVLRRDRCLCRRCGVKGRKWGLEVNHIVPILGRHSQSGCHHHNEGLETLCHDCHVLVTAAQFGYRTAAPKPQGVLNLA